MASSQLDSRNSVHLISINFSTAFNTISRNKLIHKLQKYGIGEKTLSWVREFINKRTFSVCINSAHSENFPVDSFVPQGTKLDPLMNIPFANDIVKLFKLVKIKMYADDISL